MLRALAGHHGAGAPPTAAPMAAPEPPPAMPPTMAPRPAPPSDLATGFLAFAGAFRLDVRGHDLVFPTAKRKRVRFQRDLVGAFHGAGLLQPSPPAARPPYCAERSTRPSIITGSSSSALNVIPAFAASTSIASVRRTLSIVLAGTVTGAGAFDGSGAGAGGALRGVNSSRADVLDRELCDRPVREQQTNDLDVRAHEFAGDHLTGPQPHAIRMERCPGDREDDGDRAHDRDAGTCLFIVYLPLTGRVT